MHPKAKNCSDRVSRPGKRGWILGLALGLVGAGSAGADKLADPLGKVLGSSNVTAAVALTNLQPLKIFGQITALAKELRSPDGIARDKETGDLYVVEEDAAAIVRIESDGTKKLLFDSTTPLYEKLGGTTREVTGLRSPEGLALDGKGTLYVVEDVPGGRLIAFSLKGKTTGSRARGEVVPLPIPQHQFAWESIDVGPAGDLLLAGSTMESMTDETGQGALFRGAIVYRDAAGQWWMPMNHAMASYSAVCFAADGQSAFFACEFSGDVGCLDLRTQTLRTFRSQHRFRSPEGLCALPSGSVVVAEESGRIYWLDPVSDKVQLLHDQKGAVESVAWDETGHRMLLTADQQGELLVLEQRGRIDLLSAVGAKGLIAYEERSIPVEMIPDKCPKYLAKVLKLGGYDPLAENGKLGFRDFARRYCLIAIDAEAELMAMDGSVEDPIVSIQFVVVAPYLIGIQDGELIWSSSGFTAIKKSGQKVKTELVQRQIIQGDLMESRYMPVGGQTIALPMPFSARINVDGTTSVNFMGMGAMPDFYLVLNTVETSESVMIVMPPGHKPQQYRLHLPAGRDKSHWVVALERKEPDVWRRLGVEP